MSTPVEPREAPGAASPTRGRGRRAGLTAVAVAAVVAGGLALAQPSGNRSGLEVGLGRSEGVAPGTIKLGFIVNVGADGFFGSFQNPTGAGETQFYGDEKAQVNALVDDVNRRGGIAGRTVVPVFAEMRWGGALQGGPEANYARICTQLVEDERVFAAITSEILGVNPTLAACFKRHHTLLLTLPFVPGDDEFAQNVRPFYQMPAAKTDSRAWQTLIPELAAQGFFGTEPRIGLVVGDVPGMTRVVNDDIRPALGRLGLAVAEEVKLPFGNGQAQGTAAATVLRFKEKNISHVFFVPSFDLGYYFLQAADAQGYRPRYAVESGWDPEFFRVWAPTSQLRSSLGIGWRPQYDVPDRGDPPYNSQEERCFGVMRAAGVSVKTRSDPYPALVLCDNLWLFEAAAHRAGPKLTTETWLRGLQALGSSWQSSVTFTVDVGRGRADGSSSHRLLAFDDGCACFVYKGDVVPDEGPGR